MFIQPEQAIKEAYDIAIIGAGAAGITLAHKFAESRQLKVLLIETGGLEFNQKAAALSEVEAEGHFPASHFSIHSQRIFGGTTSVWSNMSSMLEERSFINKEWPITFDAIKPYYEEATNIITLRDGSFEEPYSKFTPRNIIQYRPYYKSYKRSTRMGKKYHSELEDSKHVDVLLNSTCINIHQKNKGIESLLIRRTQEDGSDFTVKANKFILACGAIGNSRVMQISNIGDQLPVGQYLMEHPHFIDSGFIQVNKATLAPVIYTSKTIHAFSLSDKFCLDNNLLNATISFKDHKSEDKVLLGRQQDCFTSICSMRTEMPALASNKTFLLDEKDHWGLPKQKVILDLNYDKEARNIWKLFAREMLVSDIARLTEFDEKAVQVIGGGHLMGTTRMGTQTTTSVVDKNCKVHNIDNLYIAGSSIFSASCAANPTYSIVAFSLRLADYLISQKVA